jgi:hypothetical protein
MQVTTLHMDQLSVLAEQQQQEGAVVQVAAGDSPAAAGESPGAAAVSAEVDAALAHFAASPCSAALRTPPFAAVEDPAYHPGECHAPLSDVLNWLQEAAAGSMVVYENFVGSPTGILCRRCHRAPASHAIAAEPDAVVWLDPKVTSGAINGLTQLLGTLAVLFSVYVFVTGALGPYAVFGGIGAWVVIIIGRYLHEMLRTDEIVIDPEAGTLAFNGKDGCGEGAWSCDFARLPTPVAVGGPAAGQPWRIVLPAPAAHGASGVELFAAPVELFAAPDAWGGDARAIATIVGEWDVFFRAAPHKPMEHRAALKRCMVRGYNPRSGHTGAPHVGTTTESADSWYRYPAIDSQ